MADGTYVSRKAVWLAIAALFGTAVAGGFVGAAVDRMYWTNRPPWNAALSGPGGGNVIRMPDGEVARSGSPLGRGFGRGRGLGMPEAPRQFAERLARDLELTDDQRRQVEGILERQVPQMRAASDSVRALIERPLEETRVQLLSILSPEQKKKFLKLLEAEPRPVMVRRF